VAYLIGLHALLAGIIWAPEQVERLRKFWFRSPDQDGEYRGMVSAQVRATRLMPDGAAVFLGDSRLRDLDVTAVTDGPVLNLSIGGDTTRGLLGRLPRYARLDRCRVVVVAVGVNDPAHFDDDEIASNYDQILGYLHQTGVRRVVVCSVIPVDETKHRQATSARVRGLRVDNRRVAGLDDRLRELCSRYPGVRFAATPAGLIGPDGNLRPECSDDGLHFTAEGNRVWAAALRRDVQAAGG
jgi:lysophospholipase L1-like esterase